MLLSVDENIYKLEIVFFDGMVWLCLVLQCKPYVAVTAASLHVYPRGKTQGDMWFAKLKIRESDEGSYKMCSKHFKECDFLLPEWKYLAGIWQHTEAQSKWKCSCFSQGHICANVVSVQRKGPLTLKKLFLRWCSTWHVRIARCMPEMSEIQHPMPDSYTKAFPVVIASVNAMPYSSHCPFCADVKGP